MAERNKDVDGGWGQNTRQERKEKKTKRKTQMKEMCKTDAVIDNQGNKWCPTSA